MTRSSLTSVRSKRTTKARKTIKPVNSASKVNPVKSSVKNRSSVKSSFLGFSKSRLANFTFLTAIIFIIGSVILVQYVRNNSSSVKGITNGTLVYTGAESNIGLLPAIPAPAATITVNNGDQLRAALAGSLPSGSVIELNDGEYTGGQFLVKPTTIGTQANPVIIRSKNLHKAIISTCGGQQGSDYKVYCFRLEGQNVILTGLTFQNTKWSNVNVLGRYNRVSNNRFIDAGIVDNNPGDFKNSIIGSYDGTGNIDALIDSNYILRPRNIPFAINEKNYGITISHNTIEGPHSISSGGSRERNAFKIGCCSNADATAYQANPIIIQFNTIKNFGTSDPYFGSSKVPYTKFVFNAVLGDSGDSKPYVWETRGRVSEGNIIYGNYMQDGAIILEDSNQLVKNNVILARRSWYGAGNLIFLATQGVVNNYGVYDPQFYTGVTDSRIENNLFGINVTVGAITNVQQGNLGCAISNNTIIGNKFLSPTSANLDSCMSSKLTAESANNTIGSITQSPVAMDASNVQVAFVGEYTRYLTGTVTSTPPPTTTTPPPTTTTPPPTVTTPVTVTGVTCPGAGQTTLVEAETAIINPNMVNVKYNTTVSVAASTNANVTGGKVLAGFNNPGQQSIVLTSGSGTINNNSKVIVGVTYLNGGTGSPAAANTTQRTISINGKSTTISFAPQNTAGSSAWENAYTQTCIELNAVDWKTSNTIMISHDASQSSDFVNIDKVILWQTPGQVVIQPNPNTSLASCTTAPKLIEVEADNSAYSKFSPNRTGPYSNLLGSKPETNLNTTGGTVVKGFNAPGGQTINLNNIKSGAIDETGVDMLVSIVYLNGGTGSPAKSETTTRTVSINGVSAIAYFVPQNLAGSYAWGSSYQTACVSIPKTTWKATGNTLKIAHTKGQTATFVNIDRVSIFKASVNSSTISAVPQSNNTTTILVNSDTTATTSSATTAQPISATTSPTLQLSSDALLTQLKTDTNAQITTSANGAVLGVSLSTDANFGIIDTSKLPAGEVIVTQKIRSPKFGDSELSTKLFIITNEIFNDETLPPFSAANIIERFTALSPQTKNISIAGFVLLVLVTAKYIWRGKIL